MTSKIISTGAVLLFFYSLLLLSGFFQTYSSEPMVYEEIKQLYLRTEAFIELNAPDTYPSAEKDRFVWHSEIMSLPQTEGRSIRLAAPASPGSFRLSCVQYRGRKKIATFHYQLTVYKQIIILKADDLVSDSLHVFPPYWNRYFNLLDSLEIAGSAGIIGTSLEGDNPTYFEKIKNLHQTGRVEFWNHGYTHTLRGRNEKGEEYHEFFNSGHPYQAEHLARTQALGQEKLNIRFRAFGAPGNFIDQNTRKLIDADKDICIWLYGDEYSPKSIAKKRPGFQIEFPVHYPDFERFRAKYVSSEPVVTIQFHPTRWDEARLHEFRKMLLFLQEQQVTFMTPSTFGQIFHPELFQEPVLL